MRSTWWSAGAVCSMTRARDHALVVDLDDRAQRVDPGLLQPVGGPRGEVATTRDLELAQQVGQLGVVPRVRLEVPPQALHELLAPDVRDQLLEHRRALGVGDAVEVDLDVLEVADGGHDRVRRAELVLAVGPGLLGRVERRPGPRPAGRLGLRDGAGPLGERLVEPQVVPPAHRHEVAEPHVRQLVQDRQRATLDDRLGHGRPEDVGLQEGHRAGVLHGPGVELGHEELVVLLERVGEVEHLLEAGEALPGDLHDLVGVEELRQAAAAVDPERDHPAVAARQLAALDVIGPGDDRRDVGRQQRRRREPPGGPALAGRLRAPASG